MGRAGRGVADPKPAAAPANARNTTVGTARAGTQIPISSIEVLAIGSFEMPGFQNQPL